MTISAKRLSLALGAFLLAAALAGGVQARLEQWPGHASLAGQLLVASPDIEDPRFRRTVILVVRHNKDGALGITLNRPVGEISLASLLKSLGEKDPAARGNVRVFAGGPVQSGAVFVIHSTDYSRAEINAINGLLAATSSKEILRDIGQNKGPQKTLIALGYAGWGPGQLEAEIARHDWETAVADAALVFDEKRERLWDVAMERRLHDL